MATYKIKPGDSLSKIAEQNGTTVQALLAANPQIKNQNLIYAGANLNVPSQGSGVTEVDFAPGTGNITSVNKNATLPKSNTPVAPAPGSYSTPNPGSAPVTVTQPTNTSQNANIGANNTPGSSGTQTATGIPYDSALSAYGIDQATWNSLNATQQAVVSIAMKTAKSNYSANASALSVQDAIKQASQDPSVIGPYADALGIDKEQFQQNIQTLQQSITLQSQQQQTQFENERKALAQKFAAAGQAYSGFRGEAQQQLGQTEQGIVTSSQSQLQKELNDAQAAFESKYGTTAALQNPANVQFNNPLNSAIISPSGLDIAPGSNVSTLSGATAEG